MDDMQAYIMYCKGGNHVSAPGVHVAAPGKIVDCSQQVEIAFRPCVCELKINT